MPEKANTRGAIAVIHISFWRIDQKFAEDESVGYPMPVNSTRFDCGSDDRDHTRLAASQLITEPVANRGDLLLGATVS